MFDAIPRSVPILPSAFFIYWLSFTLYILYAFRFSFVRCTLYTLNFVLENTISRLPLTLTPTQEPPFLDPYPCGFFFLIFFYFPWIIFFQKSSLFLTSYISFLYFLPSRSPNGCRPDVVCTHHQHAACPHDLLDRLLYSRSSLFVVRASLMCLIVL